MRKFAFLAVAAAAFAFFAPSKAQAQIITSSSYYGGYSNGYSPYAYGNSIYTNNLGIGLGLNTNGGYSPGYYGGYRTYGGYSNGYGYRNYNSSSYYRGNSYGNYGGYSRGGFGGRRR